MTDKNDRIRRIEQLLNGPPTSTELYASAHVCERLAMLIEFGNHPEQWQAEKLREIIDILREWGFTTGHVEAERCVK